MNLSEACTDCNLRIKCLQGVDCQRLREFGLSEGTRIYKISDRYDKVVCTACGVKVVVSKTLCEQIIVDD